MGKLWNWFGRMADGLSLWQFVAGLGAVGSVMGWAATGFHLIAEQGWGAVVFAGLFGAPLLLSALLLPLALYRVFRPLPAAALPDLFGPVQSPGLSPHEQIEGLESLRDSVGAVAQALREQEEATKALSTQDQAKAILASLDEANKQIREVRDQMKNADHTILRLVDFATCQAVAASLDELITSAPPILPDNELSEESRTTQLEYIGEIHSRMAGTHRGQSVAGILQAAEHEAERIIEETPVNERNPADPIRYRRWAIANRQVEKLVMFLKAQQAEVQRKIVWYRTELIEELTKRSHP